MINQFGSASMNPARLYSFRDSKNGRYQIDIFQDRVSFTGNYMYLKDKEFYRNKGQQDVLPCRDFIGMGYLSLRSYRKTLLFLFIGTGMILFQQLMDKISEVLEDANGILQWFGEALEMPEFMQVIMNILIALSFAAMIYLFFSKKKVIEISFVNRRICVPQNSMSPMDFQIIYQQLKQLQTNR